MRLEFLPNSVYLHIGFNSSIKSALVHSFLASVSEFNEGEIVLLSSLFGTFK